MDANKKESEHQLSERSTTSKLFKVDASAQNNFLLVGILKEFFREPFMIILNALSFFCLVMVK